MCVCVTGIEGVVQAYRQCLPQLKLSGPTNFAPIINHAACFARQALQQNVASVSYTFLKQTRHNIFLSSYPNKKWYGLCILNIWHCLKSFLAPSAAVLRAAHYHRWSDHRHGPDMHGYCQCFSSPHVHHHSGRGGGRLWRNGVPRQWWCIAVFTQRSCRHKGHCAVCALQRFPSKQHDLMKGLSQTHAHFNVN